jgi:signal transduction histidine kinase
MMLRTLGADALVLAKAASDGPPRCLFARGLTAAGQACVQDVLRQAEPRLSRERQLDLRPAEQNSAASAFAGLGFRGALGAIIELEGRRRGTLCVLRREPGAFPNADLLPALARHFALALALEEESSVPSARLLTEHVGTLEALDRLVPDVKSYEELMAALTSVVGQTFGAAKTGLMVWDEQHDTLQMVPGSLGGDAATVASYQVSPLDSRSNAARVFTTGQPFLMNEVRADTAVLQDYAEAFAIQRVVTLALEVRGRPIGVLHLANKAEEFTIDDLRSALALAPHIATLVMQAERLLVLHRQQQLEGIVAAVAVAIASGETLGGFLVSAFQELAVVMDAGFITMVPAAGEPIVHRRTEGHPQLERILLREAAEGPGVRAYAIAPRRAGDPGWAAFHVPVVLHDRRVGTLSALRARGVPFGDDERRAMSRLASLSALAWASEGYQRQREELSRLRDRQRIADDLHDDVAQLLFAAQLSLDATLDAGDLPAAAAGGIVHARGLLVRGDAAIRTVIQGLAQPPATDFGRRLAAAVADIEEEFPLAVHLDLDPAAAAVSARLRRATADLLVRVAREAMVNAAKHAGPCQVTVSLGLTERGRLRVQVADDGLGLADRRSGGGHGLVTLRQAVRDHGGTLRVHAGTTSGTRVAVSVPL